MLDNERINTYDVSILMKTDGAYLECYSLETGDIRSVTRLDPMAGAVLASYGIDHRIHEDCMN